MPRKPQNGARRMHVDAQDVGVQPGERVGAKTEKGSMPETHKSAEAPQEADTDREDAQYQPRGSSIDATPTSSSEGQKRHDRADRDCLGASAQAGSRADGSSASSLPPDQALWPQANDDDCQTEDDDLGHST